MIEPPYGIIWNCLKAGKVVPFLGAGASFVGRMPDSEWNVTKPDFLPSGLELARILANEAEFPSDDPHDLDDLAKVSSYYEDISGRHPSNDNAELVGEEDLNGRKTWVVKNRPKEELDDYSWRKTWVDQETHLVLKESYFDEDGTEVRRFTTDEYKQINGFWVGIAGTMENIELEHKTTVRFSNVQLDVGIPDKVFTERSLKSAPKKWIK